jgi:hypothetical protein
MHNPDRFIHESDNGLMIPGRLNIEKIKSIYRL